MTEKQLNSQASAESFLLELWRRMLENPALTLDDDFFDMGGDSLLATEMLLQLGDLAAEAVPMSALLETGTARSFAAYLLAQKTDA